MDLRKHEPYAILILASRLYRGSFLGMPARNQKSAPGRAVRNLIQKVAGENGRRKSKTVVTNDGIASYSEMMILRFGA
jgi:hypothetical protein